MKSGKKQVKKATETNISSLKKSNTYIKKELEIARARLFEKNRDLLPQVNHFYTSLFEYNNDYLDRDVVFESNGDATVTLTTRGIKPQGPGKVIHFLRHDVFIPGATADRKTIESDFNFQVLEKPSGLKIERRVEFVSKDSAILSIIFPEGYHWTPGGKALSYKFSYQLRDVFAMTKEEARIKYANLTLHNKFFEWSSCRISKPLKELNLSVTYPEGYVPKNVQNWVWFQEVSFLLVENNVADKLLLDKDEQVRIEPGPRHIAKLKVKNPLFGFHYAIVWEP